MLGMLLLIGGMGEWSELTLSLPKNGKFHVGNVAPHRWQGRMVRIPAGCHNYDITTQICQNHFTADAFIIRLRCLRSREIVYSSLRNKQFQV